METQKWALDAAHTEIMFKVRHLMISNVSGHFSKFDGTVETNGDDFTTAKVNFSIDVDSISTNNEQRDGHLKSADFFDAANHPKMEFVSTKLEKADGDNYKLHGKLTIRETTKDVTFHVECGGLQKDPWGNIRAGFTIDGKVNRKEYGLHWDAVTETGGIMLADEVKFQANAEFIKVAAAVMA